MCSSDLTVSDPRSTRASWTTRLALILLGILVPLLLLEILVRLLGPLLPGDYQTASFVETHPAFGRRNRPGAGWKKTSEYTTWVEVNSRGLRGVERDLVKPAGTSRVLVLGDSFTFAEQVGQPETFVQRLEDQLNQRDESSWEVQIGRAHV